MSQYQVKKTLSLPWHAKEKEYVCKQCNDIRQLFDKHLAIDHFWHTPVLLDEVLSMMPKIEGKKSDILIIDATIGLGWHASEILTRLPEGGTLLCFDRDAENLRKSDERLHALQTKTQKSIALHLVHASFTEIGNTLARLDLPAPRFILYDLGVSSVHYDSIDRGFSFRSDSPLDMRFDRNEWIPTAADWIAKEDERTLMHIMQDFGEEPKAFFIAKAIVEARAKKPILTTGDLIHIIETSSFDPKSKIRVFQAFRIAVNAEFDHITRSIEKAMSLMAPGGRIAVITFHSLEDRLIKHCFEKACSPTIDELTGRILVPGAFIKVNRKPIIPTSQEIVTNPRSRSAKLRCIEKRK